MSRGFWSREVWPRRDQIFFHRYVLISLLGSGVLTFTMNRWGTFIAVEVPSFAEASTALIAYGAVTFGACVTGATLSVALPSGRMLSTMTLNSSDPGTRAIRIDVAGARAKAVFKDDQAEVSASDFASEFRSRYLDLVFLFTYSAMIQLFVIGVGLAAIGLFGDAALFGCGCDARSSIAFTIIAFFAMYSVAQLMACLRAIYQIATIRDAFIRAASLRGDGPPVD